MKPPDFSFEKKLWKKGFRIVAGLDEVGRGCFAGPVVAAACVFDSTFKGLALQGVPAGRQGVKIDDSKRLSSKQREMASVWIKKNAYTWGIGEASVSQINRLGMAKATRVAFRKAVISANNELRTMNSELIDYLLIDAFFVPYVSGLPVGREKLKTYNSKLKTGTRQSAIVEGDAKSVSIAAASILAKVYRDKLMANTSFALQVSID